MHGVHSVRSVSCSETKKYYGFYRAIVKNNQDPEKRGRLKITIPEVIGSIITDWADPLAFNAGGSPGTSNLFIPEIEAKVFATFEGGDVNRPLWIGGWSLKGELPPEATSGGQTIHNGKGQDSFTNNEQEVITEPSIQYDIKYPNNKVIKTKAGHTIELDDTPTKERVNIHHKSGSYVEILPDGKMMLRSKNTKYSLIDNDDNEHIKGNKNLFVESSIDIKSTDITTINGNGGLRLESTKTFENAQYSTYILLDSENGKITLSAPISIVLEAAGSIELNSLSNLVKINNNYFTGIE